MIWRGLAIAFRLFSYEHGIFYVRPYFRFDSILIGCLIALWLCSSTTAYERLKSFAQHSWSAALWITLFLWATVGERFSRTLHITISEILAAIVLSGENMPFTLAALWRSHFVFALSLAGIIYLAWTSVLGIAPRTASRIYRTDCDRCRVVSPYGTSDPPAQKPFGARSAER